MFDFARERTALHSAYPERHTPREGWWDVQGSRLISPVIRWRRVRRCLSTNVVERVSERGRILARQSDEQLSQQAGELRERLRRGGLSEELVYRAFSRSREPIPRGSARHSAAVRSSARRPRAPKKTRDRPAPPRAPSAEGDRVVERPVGSVAHLTGVRGSGLAPTRARPRWWTGSV